ncbi:MAG: ABC transporter permease [Spirochaetales bacterium]
MNGARPLSTANPRIERAALVGARAHLGNDRAASARTLGWWFVAEHRLRTMRAYLWSILMGSIGSPFFYLFSLGVGLGALIDSNSGAKGVDGVNYITFVGPALLASAAITSAYEELSFPVMGGFKWTREFWAMNATSITPGQIVVGVILAAFARVILTVTVFWAILAAFGAAPSALSLLAVPATMLAGLAFGAPMMAFAATLENDDGYFAMIGRFVIAPMFLFSGTFYPLTQLPTFLQAIGWVSPLWHATELGRMLTYGRAEEPWLVVVHLGYLLVLSVVGLYLAFRVFARRLSK